MNPIQRDGIHSVELLARFELATSSLPSIERLTPLVVMTVKQAKVLDAPWFFLFLASIRRVPVFGIRPHPSFPLSYTRAEHNSSTKNTLSLQVQKMMVLSFQHHSNNCGSPALWYTGTPPPYSFLRGFCLVFSLPFSDNQSPKYDRPTKKYYIIKAQRERNTTPQNKNSLV